jgi:hypothetical protein
MKPQCMGTTGAGTRCMHGGRPADDGWVGCKFHPRKPDPVIVDPSCVVIVRDRLLELYPKIPESITGARHLLEWCLVDLGRALGEIPTTESETQEDG